MGVLDRLAHGWNAFKSEGQVSRFDSNGGYGASYSIRPDMGGSRTLRVANERSIVSAIYTRLSIDVAAMDVRHVRVDGNGRYVEDIPSKLNYCLTDEANIDQEAQAFRRDVVHSMFEEGVIAVVPVDTTLDPNATGGFDVETMRVGTVTTWFPQHVRVHLYNEKTGMREDVTVPKSAVAIIENPFYTVMNEPNSTLQRLIRTLGRLDAVDDQSASGKLDIIMQLPYQTRTEVRREQAKQRRVDLEAQLKDSKYGVGYIDATEKITQLNRPVDNNMQARVEYLTNMLFGQLGLTPEIMNGTADPAAMVNYINRTLKPIMDAITRGMRRAFLTKTARKQGQTLMYFKEPFALVPIDQLADVIDKLSRNEVMSPNEFRQVMGLKPSQDPKADKLINSNMPQPGLPPEQQPGTAPDVIDSEAFEVTNSQGLPAPVARQGASG